VYFERRKKVEEYGVEVMKRAQEKKGIEEVKVEDVREPAQATSTAS